MVEIKLVLVIMKEEKNNSDFDLYLDMGPVLEGGKTYVIPTVLNLMPIDGKNVFPDRLYHSFTGTGKPGSYSNEPSTDETNINNFQIFIQRISAKGPHSNIFEISTNNEDMKLFGYQMIFICPLKNIL